jgi:hypothetical protein
MLVIVFALIVVIACLSSCAVVSIANRPPDALQSDTLEALVGATSEQIIEELGAPAEVVGRDGTTNFIYRGWGERFQTFFLLYIPIPVGFEDAIKYCALLRFDNDNRLDEYEIKGWPSFEVEVMAPSDRSSSPPSCLEILGLKSSLKPTPSEPTGNHGSVRPMP